MSKTKKVTISLAPEQQEKARSFLFYFCWWKFEYLYIE